MNMCYFAFRPDGTLCVQVGGGKGQQLSTTIVERALRGKRGDGCSGELKVMMGRLYEQMEREAKILDKMADKIVELEIILKAWDKDE